MLLFPTTGLLLDRFKILRQLGSGNMGVVYAADDRKLGTKVALKVLSEANAAGIYRLKQEFRAIADVVHPNLVGLHELFSTGDTWFFTMDLVEGAPLLRQLGPDPDYDRLRKVFAQLAAGIQAIHNTGKLHRDLKPNNVLLTPEDRVVILDFGLVSEEAEGGVGQTLLEDSISGTPAYMAPELTLGHRASRAGDWYAFGIMLFEALVGRAPFEGSVRNVLTSKTMYDAPRLSSHLKDVPDDLDDLCIRLLSRKPEERPGYEEAMRVLKRDSEPVPAPIPLEEIPFVGRKEELEQLSDALDVTHQGRPVVVLIRGPSGVGKSTLVEHFLSGLRKSKQAVVLTGRCYEKESVPFKACDSLVDALTHYLRQLPERQCAQMMPRQILALERIFPVLNRLDVVKHTKQRHPLPPNPNELRRVAFLAAKELLANIAAQEPLVLYVDDMQWSDVDGAKMLSSLVSQPEAPAALLIAAHRIDEEEGKSGLATFRNNLEEMVDLEVRDIDLRELDERNARELAGNILPNGKKEMAQFVARESRGNPFFISTLARFVETVPATGEKPSLESAVGRQVGLLSDSERVTLETVCVSTRPVEADLLQAALPGHRVADALRALEILRLVRHSGSVGWIAAYHDRIRETVVEGMDKEKLVSCHRRIVRALEQTRDPDPVLLTEHLLGSGELRQAGGYASRAATQATEALAFENAARFYRIAIAHDPGDDHQRRALETALGEALAHAGRRDEAAQAFMRASEGAAEDDALELRRRAAEQWINTGHMDRGAEALDAVLRTLGLKLHASPFGSLTDMVLNRTHVKLRGLGFQPRPAADASKRDLLKLKACEDVMIGFWAAAPYQAMAFCSHYLRLALKLGITEDVVKGLSTEAVARSFLGGRGRRSAHALIAHAKRLCERVEDPETRAYLHLAQGMGTIAQGDYPQTIGHLKQTERICLRECTRKTANLEIAQSFLGIAYTRLGKWRVLQEEWDRWTESAKEVGNLHQLTICRVWPMGVYRWLASDRADRARHDLQRGIEAWPWPGFDLQRVYAKVSESYIHLYTGDYKRAFDIYGPLWDRVRHSPLHRIQMHRIVYTFSYAQCALALASVSAHRQPLLRIAESRARELSREGTPVAHPFAAAIRGTIEANRGRDDEAVAWLGKAAELFETEEYKLYAAAVRYRLGGLMGGDEGNRMVIDAEAAMEEESIQDKSRVAAMLAPGFPDQRQPVGSTPPAGS